VLAIGIIFQPDIIDRSLSVFRGKENRERLYTWHSTLYMIKDSPLCGIGKGNYSDLVSQYRNHPAYRDFDFSSKAHAHNNILQVAVESGIPSLLAFLWFWGILFRTLYRNARKHTHSPAMHILCLGALGTLCAFFVQGFFEFNFGDDEVVMMMWLFAALSLKLHVVADQNR
jgi:O-antigen ligase